MQNISTSRPPGKAALFPSNLKLAECPLRILHYRAVWYNNHRIAATLYGACHRHLVTLPSTRPLLSHSDAEVCVVAMGPWSGSLSHCAKHTHSCSSTNICTLQQWVSEWMYYAILGILDRHHNRCHFSLRPLISVQKPVDWFEPGGVCVLCVQWANDRNHISKNYPSHSKRWQQENKDLNIYTYGYQLPRKILTSNFTDYN
jgi:hypothetical protein